MKPLTQDEVEQLVGEVAPTTHCSDFNPEQLSAFIEIWQNRLEDATTYHNRKDLVSQAQGVIAFAARSGHDALRLFTCSSERTGRVGFLYDTRTKEFLQIGDRKPINSEQSVAPNRSLLPTLNSTSSVRGPEDF